MMNNNNFDFNENWNEPEKNNNNKDHSFLKQIRNGVIFGLCAGLVFTGVNKVAGNTLKTTTSTSSNTAQVVQTSTNTNSETVYDVSTVAKEAMPSMVSIDVTSVQTYQTSGGYFFGGGNTYQKEVQGSGSGIIFSQTDDYLYILTNYHVVEDANKIKVSFIDENSYEATVTGYDEDHDLAVVQVPLSDISKDTLSQIKVAAFASSDDLTLGQPCVAIGNALGYGQSVTVGYVSATAREVQTTDNTQTLIQTDAAINPGNSGGALLNMNGEVIGINSAKYSDTDVEGMGFAIPVSTIMEVVPDLINGAKNDAKTVYLGITGTAVTESYVNAFGWPEGIYISKVTSNSPAQNAGIQAGDILIGFKGEEITDMSTLQSMIQACSVGEEVEVTIARQQSNGEFKEIKVTATLAEYVESNS